MVVLRLVGLGLLFTHHYSLQSYPVSSLMREVEEITRISLSSYQLHFQDKPLQAVRHGKQLTLRDYRIKKGETLFINKLGFSLDITNPQVHNTVCRVMYMYLCVPCYYVLLIIS